MMELWYALVDLLPFEWAQPGSMYFMKNALLAVLVISPLFGILSTMVVHSRMSFFSDALGHSAFTGMAIGALCGFSEPTWAAVLFSLVFALLFNFVRRRTRLASDTVIGVFSSTAVALGIFISTLGSRSFTKFNSLLIGDILSVEPGKIGLLALILLLFAGCLLHPAAAGYGTPTAAYTALPAVQGILDGYQTMDTLAGLNFGAVIALNIQALGVTEPREVERGTIRAGFLAAGLFAVVYAMLTHIGGIAGAAFPGCETGAETLTLLANALFGRVGQVLLAAIFIIACFNTCVGLISGVSEYFHQLWPKVPYTGWAAFFALTSMLLSNIGLASILELSVPILNAIYPAAIVLIFLSFLPGRFQRCSVYSWAIGLAALQSIPAALPLGPVAALANNLPLGALGFGWLLPAAVGMGIGFLKKS